MVPACTSTTVLPCSQHLTHNASQKARHQIGNGITDQRDHALNCWSALSSADNRTTLETRNMSRIVARLFTVACQHSTSRSAVAAGRTPAFIRSLSSSQGKGSVFCFDRSLHAAVSLNPESAQCYHVPPIIEYRNHFQNIHLNPWAIGYVHF